MPCHACELTIIGGEKEETQPQKMPPRMRENTWTSIRVCVRSSNARMRPRTPLASNSLLFSPARNALQPKNSDRGIVFFFVFLFYANRLFRLICFSLSLIIPLIGCLPLKWEGKQRGEKKRGIPFNVSTTQSTYFVKISLWGIRVLCI